MSCVSQQNILFVHHSSSMGGAERYLLSVIEALDKHYNVFFIEQEEGPLTMALAKLGVKSTHMRLRAWRKPKNFILNIISIIKIIGFCKTNKIDILISGNYRVSPYVVWPAKFLKLPTITVIQDFVDGDKLAKFCVFSCECCVAVSSIIAEGLKKNFPGKIVRIYNGINVALFIATSRKDVDLRQEFPRLKGKRIVGMVAHLAPLKGHRNFLNAMKSVADRFDDVAFVVVGGALGQDQLSVNDLERFALELGIADRVVFTGARDNSPALMRSFDIFVHPSHKEAFGRVIMEAMALSIPVVATSCGGPAEIIEDGKSGILVAVNDDVAMAKAVVDLLSDDVKRVSLGQAGRNRVDQFSIERTVGEFSKTIGSILDLRAKQ